MPKRYTQELRDELVRAVMKHQEPLGRAAGRLGVPASTAFRWLQRARAGADAGSERAPTPAPRPVFVELVPERTRDARLVVRVGVAEVDVRPGFDAALLRAVVEVLSGSPA